MIKSIEEVFGHKGYFWGFVALAVFFFWILIFIPVKAVPGNDFQLQLSLLSNEEFLLFMILSMLTSLSIIFHLYILKHQRSKKVTLSLVGQSGVGIISGVIASIFGTATCAACLTFIFGLLGVSGVLFLVDYRIPITIGAILFLLISLYFTSQKILGVCKTCKI